MSRNRVSHEPVAIRQLSTANREQARAMFMDAGTGDGYWYEFGQDGTMRRNRRLVDETEEAPGSRRAQTAAARMTA